MVRQSQMLSASPSTFSPTSSTPRWHQVDKRICYSFPRTRDISIYASGALFAIGWWSFIDGLVYLAMNKSENLSNVTVQDWICGILTTIGMIITLWKARRILLIGYTLLAGGFIGSLTVFYFDYITQNRTMEQFHFGIAMLIQNVCILMSSVYIENKLYILGGYNNGPLDNLLYLDLSNSFHKDHPPWYNLDFREIPFGVYKAAANFGGIDNSTIFLIGGERSEKNINYVYSFNTKSFVWNDSLINDDNDNPEWHIDIQGVTDRNGKIYIYGGWLSGIRSNKLSILDTLRLSWTIGPSPDSQNSRYGNTITLLSNGIIVIIGGYVDGGGGLYEILLYDTNENNWNSMITQGIKLSDRVYHTAVLTNDGKIIVYGGTKNNHDPDLVILDTNFQPFKWSTLEVNAINSPPSLFGHTANLIGDYMILVFVPKPPEPPAKSNKSFISKRMIFQLFCEIVVIFLILCENLDQKHISTYLSVIAIYISFVFVFNLMLFFR
ncbi:9333_t:CDS:2 [Diversispora eburnea]|uniref:9333_t:CDS:1 n=1 Tax=Diversispora eburnea TaxID=1213867 RepID=A0A9N8WRF8_9GLOM|nr:9333_t:CDS:2 [Diversispora eburnea]